MHDQNEELAWSMYWAADRLHSCVASDTEADQFVLNSVWQEFANPLNKGAKVLDLATGNGAVPAALLGVRPDLQIDAVDQADIEPEKFLSNYPSLKSVQFHANTDINGLTFEHQSFDAISSQFGIEYAGLNDATVNALKFLKQGGSFLFIIHHSKSALIQSSLNKILEMELVLESNGLLDQLDKFLQAEIPFSQLEHAGKEYLDSQGSKTEEISGQVFQGINQIVTSMENDSKTAGILGKTLRFKFLGEYQRLRQMQRSAQSEEEMTVFKQLLQDQCVDLRQHKQLFADNANDKYLLGWLIEGSLRDIGGS